MVLNHLQILGWSHDPPSIDTLNNCPCPTSPQIFFPILSLSNLSNHGRNSLPMRCTWPRSTWNQGKEDSLWCMKSIGMRRCVYIYIYYVYVVNIYIYTIYGFWLHTVYIYINKWWIYFQPTVITYANSNCYQKHSKNPGIYWNKFGDLNSFLRKNQWATVLTKNKLLTPSNTVNGQHPVWTSWYGPYPMDLHYGFYTLED